MRRMHAAALTLGFLAGGNVGCAVEQTEACRAFVGCLDRGIDSRGDEDDLHAAYGEMGDCWRTPTEDAYFAACDAACTRSLQELCADVMAGGDAECIDANLAVDVEGVTLTCMDLDG